MVENQLDIPAWRNGFCIADRILILLYRKPSHYGKTFYDRKSCYSINVQIIDTPNQQIIDYASEFQRSKHDIYCFKSTRLGEKPAYFLDEEE